MKLYEVPRYSIIKIIKQDVEIPPEATEVSKGETLKFYHIDGMYSFCKNFKDEIVHIAAWTEVEVIGAFEKNE